jgi:hypothetical protein
MQIFEDLPPSSVWRTARVAERFDREQVSDFLIAPAIQMDDKRRGQADAFRFGVANFRWFHIGARRRDKIMCWISYR